MAWRDRRNKAGEVSFFLNMPLYSSDFWNHVNVSHAQKRKPTGIGKRAFISSNHKIKKLAKNNLH